MKLPRTCKVLAAAAVTAIFLSRIVSPARAAGFGVDGADFLKIPVGARPAALGGAYDALADDPYAAAFNPAGLGFASSAGVAATYLSYMDSVSYDALSAAVPLRDRSGAPSGNGLGASVQYFSPGSVSGTDVNGNPAGNFNGHYLVADVAYGRSVSSRLSFGVGAKMISAAIKDVSATAYAADLGAMYRLSDRVTLSAVAANLGNSLKFIQSSDPLPRQYRFGAAVRAVPSLQLVAQGLYEDGGAGFNAGTEWTPLAPLALRAGYQSEAAQGLSGAAGLTLGAGVRYGRIELDYAWVPMGSLGATSFFSLVMSFGRGGRSADEGGPSK